LLCLSEMFQEFLECQCLRTPQWPIGVWNSSSVSYSGCMRLRFSLWCCHQPWQGLMGQGVVSQTRPNQPQCRSLSVSHTRRKGLMTTSRFPCAHGTHQTLEKCSVKSIIKSKYMYSICHGGLLIQQFHTLRLAQRHVTVANQIIYACTNRDVAHGNLLSITRLFHWKRFVLGLVGSSLWD